MRAPAQVSCPVKQVAVYLTPGDVADLLQVSVKTVYRWAKDDPLMPVLRIGGCVRFPRERLLTWLRASEHGHQSRKPLLAASQVRELSEARSPEKGACAHPCAQDKGERP